MFRRRKNNSEENGDGSYDFEDLNGTSSQPSGFNSARNYLENWEFGESPEEADKTTSKEDSPAFDTIQDDIADVHDNGRTYEVEEERPKRKTWFSRRRKTSVNTSLDGDELEREPGRVDRSQLTGLDAHLEFDYEDEKEEERPKQEGAKWRFGFSQRKKASQEPEHVGNSWRAGRSSVREDGNEDEKSSGWKFALGGRKKSEASVEPQQERRPTDRSQLTGLDAHLEFDYDDEISQGAKEDSAKRRFGFGRRNKEAAGAAAAPLSEYHE